MRRLHIGILPLIVFTLLFSIENISAQYVKRDLFTKGVSEADISDFVSNFPEWRTTSRNKVLEAVRQLTPDQKQQIIQNADKNLDFDWPSLRAWNYLDFVRNGNRSVYQGKYSDRRGILYQMVVAELIEQKNRFIPQIINGIWAVLEESSWCYPAHINQIEQNKYGLPDPGNEVLDLGAGETALNISWIYLLMKDSFQSISPTINDRILFELNRRIITPFLNTDFWWMGFPPRRENNWNIWINRNCLYTIALTGENDSVSNKMIHRILASSNNFINSYGDDGACEEGTHYWEAAPGYMSQFIGLIKEISKGKIDFSGIPLVQRMGKYIHTQYIGNGYYVDFGDAAPNPVLSPYIIFNYGKLIDDSTMMKFGSYIFKSNNFSDRITDTRNLYAFITGIRSVADVEQIPSSEPLLRTSVFPDLKLMTMRQNAGSKSGLFIATVGGNNGISHSHNDVGNFIVYVDGNPAIVDAGVGTYTAKTFGNQRYDIWTMQSSWHNLPEINGYQQKNGSSFKATEFSYDTSGKSLRFGTDIGQAYPVEAGITNWKRMLHLNSGRLTLTDSYVLTKLVEPVIQNLLTPLQVHVENGYLDLKGSDNEGNPYGLRIKFNPKKFEVKVEEKEMDDETLKNNWPDNLRRIRFICRDKHLKDKYSFQMIRL